jgi:hypothetical protein
VQVLTHDYGDRARKDKPGRGKSYMLLRRLIVMTAGSRQWPGLKDSRISCIENTKLKRRRREREKERG